MNMSAVWAAVSLISGDVASLPLVLYKTDGKKKERYTAHPLYRILHDAPNPEMSSITWRRTVQAHALTWGGGISEIERSKGGGVAHLWPITPDRVMAERQAGRLQYRISNPNGPDTTLAAEDALHIPGLGFDGISGYSVIGKARESIGLGMAAERFGATFYGNGSTFGGVFQHPLKMSDTARKNFKDALDHQHKGVDRAHKWLVVEEGMTYTRLGIPPNDAQFLETRQFQIAEIARWFNVPPHKIGDLSNATFSNIEHQSLDYYRTTLIHWLETWEQEINRKLISPLERNQQFVEHVTEGILRGDSAGRAALQTAEFQIGGLTPNETRALSNRDPITGGDTVFVPLNMIPLDRVDEWIDAQIKEKTAPPPPSAPPAAGGDREALTVLEKAVEELAQSKRQAEQRAEDLSAALAAMTESREAEIAARLELSKQLEQAEAAYRVAFDEELAKRTHVQELLDGAQVALAQEQAERALVEHGIGERDIAVTALVADLTGRDGQIAELTAERDVLLGHRVVLGEGLDLARADMLTAKAEAESAHTVAAEAAQRAAEAEAVKVAAEQRAEAAERDKAIAEQAQVAAHELVERRRLAEVKRMTDVVSAHRALMVDVLGRMVRREVEKARRHQATPQKLKAWAETFYRDETDLWVESLEPVLRAHMAWLQSDKDVTAEARAIVEAHFAQSRQQLADVLAVEDHAPVFERMLQRWETKRPEEVADQMVREAVAYVHEYR